MMEGWSKNNVFHLLHKELVDLAEFVINHEHEIQDSLNENVNFLRRMVSQVPNANSGPLLPKTPKVNRKNTVQRIETIHEDESVEFEVTRTKSITTNEIKREIESNDEDELPSRRSRRVASKKAADSIKQQQSLPLNSKLRRTSKTNEETKKRPLKESTEMSSNSENEEHRPIKQSRVKKTSIQSKKNEQDLPSEIKDATFVVETQNHKKVPETVERISITSKRKRDQTRSPSPLQMNAKRNSKTCNEEPAAKKANLIEESMDKSSTDNTLESSIYEDAIGKPAPIHNSTKIIDTTVTFDQKSQESSNVREMTNTLKPTNHAHMNVTVVLETASKHPINSTITADDGLEDEDEEEEVGCTPDVKTFTKGSLQQGYRSQLKETLTKVHKSNALFSPYGTDSVRKRVQAFEQVVISSPKTVAVDAPTRITRTKARAIAAAKASENSAQQPAQPVQSITQKLARKSLAKAKKISLAKKIKDLDDSKENEKSFCTSMKPNKLLPVNEKLLMKQQMRVTPVGKSRLQQPMSVNRLPHTPLNVQPFSNSKAMSASRANIIMNMDSFLQPNKQAQKLSLAEKIEEKRRKANEEDARRKKEEALKAHTEEKKRKREEKELKNRLAREAKEKLDREKRLKAEKEREEKARIALQIQEKQREEAERKRLLQLQRAQETEERRKQEEQLRLQRLQEQEEMERQLAEQKRKEQEAAERQHQRRLAEAKAQQQALAEAAKIKAQYQAKGKLVNHTGNNQKQFQAPTSYKIESEPDEDDDASDNEEAPKHAVPTWANAQVRRGQLALQQYIPLVEIHRYFGSRQCTPDLAQIFQGIDKRRLKRTSSAIWKTPPRYSMMFRE